MKRVRFEGREIIPSKIVCVGRNYVEHIEELGNEVPESMVLFNKPNSAVGTTLYDFGEGYRYEGEICFLVEEGKLAGVGFGLDLTNATAQNYLKSKGLPWERAKAFDDSAVFSLFVRMGSPLESIRMELYHNGTKVQEATFGLMIYKPGVILGEIGRFMHLEDGDIIMSGTPKGVGRYYRGDILTGKIYSGDELLIEESWEAIKK